MSRDEVETILDRLAEGKEVNLKVLKLKQVLEGKEINLKVLRLKQVLEGKEINLKVLRLKHLLIEALTVATTIANQQAGYKDINLKLPNFKQVFQEATKEEEAKEALEKDWYGHQEIKHLEGEYLEEEEQGVKEGNN
ncbi:hypothetical protein R1flu_000472 [Riccia fluitans]|uniref:Uncharacterized protein n=1 Tax=Riccia fluitans TaxID=41844 RepID=A0ABD1Y3Q0_9MARC